MREHIAQILKIIYREIFTLHRDICWMNLEFLWWSVLIRICKQSVQEYVYYCKWIFQEPEGQSESNLNQETTEATELMEEDRIPGEELWIVWLVQQGLWLASGYECNQVCAGVRESS